MSAGTTFDLTETNKIAALEISVAVLEFPEGCFWVTSVEYVAFYIRVSHV